MKSIVVATSSCCLQGIGITLPFELELLRMHVKVDTVEFTDGKNINSERLVEIMTNPLHPNVLASSTPASEHEVANLFAQLVQRGYNLLAVFHLSLAIAWRLLSACVHGLPTSLASVCMIPNPSILPKVRWCMRQVSCLAKASRLTISWRGLIRCVPTVTCILPSVGLII